MVKPSQNYEFDRSIPLDRLDDEDMAIAETASADECAAIAARFDIPAVQALSVDAQVKLLNKGRYVSMIGTAKADLTLTCVVTLEPFEQSFEEAIELRLAVPGRLKNDREAIPHEELSLEEAEEAFPEYLDDGKINLGEIAVEAISLGLPDHPRKPDAELPDGVAKEGAEAADEPPPGTHRPFEKLAVLKDHRKD
ncbi:MAG: DUF177 domain-containing protein [Alphaproteobacteria bacterium]|nr:DUF177 domain-containing protein [Alphaproteobacteria bacterium SS10]